jgi:hypothetical protein
MHVKASATDFAKFRIADYAAHGLNLSPLAFDQRTLLSNLLLLISELSLLSVEPLLLLINQLKHAG